MPLFKILNNHDEYKCFVCGKPIKNGEAVWMRGSLDINKTSWTADDIVNSRRDPKRWHAYHGLDGTKHVNENIFKRMYRKVRRRGN